MPSISRGVGAPHCLYHDDGPEEDQDRNCSSHFSTDFHEEQVREEKGSTLSGIQNQYHVNDDYTLEDDEHEDMSHREDSL